MATEVGGMDCGIPKLVPCSVCGTLALRHDGWFLLLENRWLDHLKILTWHPSLARKREVRSACCLEHLRVLVAYWLEEASLRLASPPFQRVIPLAGNLAQGEFELDPEGMGQLLGELSVCREPLSRSWQGTAATLESIMDALVPEAAANLENPGSGMEPRSPHRRFESVAEFMFH